MRLLGGAAQADTDEPRRVELQQRKVAWKQPAIGHEPVAKPSLGQLPHDLWEKIGRKRLTAGKDHLDRVEELARFIENPPDERQVELLDVLLMRPANAMDAMQVAEIGELETEVHEGMGAGGGTSSFRPLSTIQRRRRHGPLASSGFI